MNIVIPMAGLGSRFSREGFSVPKPLIPVFGKPMYAWAVSSLPWEHCHRLIFVCLQEHLSDHHLEDDIRSRFAGPEIHVVPLRQITRGQAETVLAAQEWIENDEPLIVFNADTHVGEKFQPVSKEGTAGIIQTFHSQDPRYSYVKVDSSGWVVEVAEKKVISELASTGLYYFERGLDFVHHSQKFLAEGRLANGEAYVMLTYESMLESGLRLNHQQAGDYWVLGTPEELSFFLKTYRGAP